MYKKLIVFSVVLVLLCLVISAYQTRAAQEINQDKSYYNKKGLSYFNEGFYKLTPKGRSDEAAQNYNLAIIEFKKAIAINDSYLEAHLNLARVYEVQKNFRLAATEYEKAIQLNPGDIDLYVKLALTLVELNQFNQAIETLQRAKSFTTDKEIINKLNGYIEKIRQEL